MATASSLFLARWLYIVAFLRMFSVILGYFKPDVLAAQVYDRVTTATATSLQSRTFATWTLTSCMLCVVCAQNPTQSAIYDATMISFFIAFFHFVTEGFVYGTVGKGMLTPFIISAASFIWMFLGRSYYLQQA